MVMLKLLESDVRYLNMKKFRGTTCFCISSACHIYLCFLSSVVSQLVDAHLLQKTKEGHNSQVSLLPPLGQ